MQNYWYIGRFIAQKFGANINIYEWEMLKTFNYISSTKQSCSQQMAQICMYYWNRKSPLKRLLNERGNLQENVLQYAPLLDPFPKIAFVFVHIYLLKECTYLP